MTRTVFEPTPEIGMGVTEFVGSDKYPYTIIDILSPKKIVVQRDDYRRIDKNGISESQQYEYICDSNGATYVLTKRKNGRWVQEGTAMKYGHWYIGERRAYSDPSF